MVQNFTIQDVNSSVSSAKDLKIVEGSSVGVLLRESWEMPRLMADRRDESFETTCTYLLPVYQKKRPRDRGPRNHCETAAAPVTTLRYLRDHAIEYRLSSAC